MEWFILAAEQVDAYAQNNLGLLNMNGTGVPQDDVHALMWVNLTSGRGDAEGPLAGTSHPGGLDAALSKLDFTRKHKWSDDKGFRALWFPPS